MVKLTMDEIKETIEFKNKLVIDIIMNNMNLSKSEATTLWYRSKTKRATFDTLEMCFVSPARAFEELQLELSNSPWWMIRPFE